MKFIPTPLNGAYLIELEPRADARGMHYIRVNVSPTQFAFGTQNAT